MIEFRRYVGLYTLSQIEDVGDLILLRVRIETLRYSFAPLAALPLDVTYAQNPRAGAQLVRQAVAPRLQTLLDTPDPFRALALDEGAVWEQYAAARGLPAQPVRVPGISAPTLRPRLPSRAKTSEWLATIQRGLETLQTAAETAATLAALWQNWQIARERRNLLAIQRELLQDAIQAQIAGQDRALVWGANRDFAQGYLADHTDDTGYDAVFGG